MPTRFASSRLAYVLFGTYLAVAYRGIGWINHHPFQADRAYMHTFEPWLPFLPGLVWLYLSYFALMLLPLLHGHPEARARFVWRALVVSLFAQFCFLAYPTSVPRLALEENGSWSIWLLNLVHAKDYKFNCFPTLHAAHSVLMGRVYGPLFGRYGIWLQLWGLAVATTVFFVRQHHWIDYLAAIALALAVHWWFERKEKQSRQPALA